MRKRNRLAVSVAVGSLALAVTRRFLRNRHFGIGTLARSSREAPSKEGEKRADVMPVRDSVEQASWESFPASDAPGWRL